MRNDRPRKSPRILLDANLYLSYLLPPADLNRAIHQVVARVVVGRCRLVFPDELLEEILFVIRTKAYFHGRVSEEDARDVLTRLRSRADMPARLESIPKIVRDPKDDYLLAHAIENRVDFLVTGDRDLLALDGEIDRLRIVTAAEFLTMLDEARSDPE